MAMECKKCLAELGRDDGLMEIARCTHKSAESQKRSDGRVNFRVSVPLNNTTEYALRRAALETRRTMGELVADLVEERYAAKENQ